MKKYINNIWKITIANILILDMLVGCANDNKVVLTGSAIREYVISYFPDSIVIENKNLQTGESFIGTYYKINGEYYRSVRSLEGEQELRLFFSLKDTVRTFDVDLPFNYLETNKKIGENLYEYSVIYTRESGIPAKSYQYDSTYTIKKIIEPELVEYTP